MQEDREFKASLGKTLSEKKKKKENKKKVTMISFMLHI
jgi:hypothetical protein